VPRARLSGELIDRLPAWLKTLHGGQTVWQWLALLSLLAVTVLASVALTNRIRRLSKRVVRPYGRFMRILASIAVALLVSVVLAVLENEVNITGDLLTAVAIGGKAVIVAMVRKVSAGRMVSDLLRQALSGSTAQDETRQRVVAGFRPFDARGVIVTNDDIDALRDGEGV